MSDLLNAILAKIPEPRAQRQDSTTAQLADVDAFLAEHGGVELPHREKMVVANRLGAYDAADSYRIRGNPDAH